MSNELKSPKIPFRERLSGFFTQGGLNEEQKQQVKEHYSLAKQKGVHFWPDIIYKDLLVSFAFFLLLLGLAIFIGVPSEPKADPSDTNYIPRPEWYFLFLFEMLKYFPGELEWIGTAVIPALAVLALFLLPFYDRNPFRHWKKRKLGLTVMGVIVLGMVALTIQAVATTPPQEETGGVASTIGEQVTAGADLYSVYCVECHGADGEGGEIVGVEGLEGVLLAPINAIDVMYTFTDETLYNTIAYGQPNLGMPPFGKAYGGELGPGDIDAVVSFLRYTWDDRAELPAEAQVGGGIPALAQGEIPSYEVHMASLFKHYCVSCHRPGKKNNNYLLQTYDEVMNSGDNAPNVIPGDLTSHMVRMVNREDLGDIGGPMPPSKELKPEYIEMIERWVIAGAPNTAAEAASLPPAAQP